VSDTLSITFDADPATGAPRVVLGDGTVVTHTAAIVRTERVENNVTFLRICYKPVAPPKQPQTSEEPAAMPPPQVGEEELIGAQAVSISAADDVHAWPNEQVVRTITVQFLESGTSVILGQWDPHGGLTPGTLPAQQGDALPAQYAAGSGGGAAEAGAVSSPIPAKVVKVLIANGGAAKKGDVVVVLESMKMESKLVAPSDGVVAIRVKVGDLVPAGKAVFVVAGAAA
jgi:biotin carboxyl carrier protein